MQESLGKVLVIEDDALLRKALLRFLTNNRYDAVGAADGLQAKRMLSQEHFDVALCDLVLPKIRGEVLIRYGMSLPRPPMFIVLTGHSSLDSAVECTKGGAFAYLEKGCGMDVLRERIAEACGAARQNEPVGAVEWTAPPATKGLRETLKEQEKKYVAEALRVSGGNRTVAARLLGMSRTALVETLKRLALKNA